MTVYVSLILVCSLVAAPAAAQSGDTPTESFRVTLEEDGDAEIQLTLTFDLDNDDEQDAFESLADDTAAQAEIRDRFANRMAAVADDASQATSREMSVSDAEVAVSTTDGVGVVTLSVHWSNLAAVDGDSFTVTEPFASGFTPDQQFVLVGPDGYTVTDATPTPDQQTENTVLWDAGADLSGFQVTFTEDAGQAQTEAPEQPGFGPVGALVVLIATLLLGRQYI